MPAGCVLCQAVAKLLEVEDAARLVHSLARPLDRRQEGQHAGHEDAGGDGEVRPAERKPGRHVSRSVRDAAGSARRMRQCAKPGREGARTRNRRRGAGRSQTTQSIEPGEFAHGRRERPARAARGPSRPRTFSIISSAFIASFIPDALRRLRHLLKLLQRGVQARLHGSDRDLEDFGDFPIFQILVIGQDQGLAKSVGQACDALAHPLLPFGFLQARPGARRSSLTSKSTRFPASASLTAGATRWSRLTVGCRPAFRSASTAW